MKLTLFCSQLMLVILFVLQSTTTILHIIPVDAHQQHQQQQQQPNKPQQQQVSHHQGYQAKYSTAEGIYHTSSISLLAEIPDGFYEELEERESYQLYEPKQQPHGQVRQQHQHQHAVPNQHYNHPNSHHYQPPPPLQRQFYPEQSHQKHLNDQQPPQHQLYVQQPFHQPQQQPSIPHQMGEQNNNLPQDESVVTGVGETQPAYIQTFQALTHEQTNYLKLGEQGLVERKVVATVGAFYQQQAPNELAPIEGIYVGAAISYHHLHPLQQQHHHHHYHHHHQQNKLQDSCNSQNPSILMQESSYKDSTCSASSFDQRQAGGSTKNVPNASNSENPLAMTHRDHHAGTLMEAIRHYWREVSGLCLASAIFLNWLFVVIKRRFIASGLTRAEHAIESLQSTTSRSVSKDTNSSSAQDSAFEETVSPISLDDMDLSKSGSSDGLDKSTHSVPAINISHVSRQRSSTLKAEPINVPISSSPGHNSLSTSLSNSLNTSDYTSRYSSDFDSIQRLGRGGFGIVFEAKNKIDDCHYAVKRICLPLEKEARERVMREVRALAKLDHAGIVRYYNAWLETPSDEWLKQHDAKLGIVHSKDGLNFPSTDGIYERNESEHIIKGSGCSKLAGSGDNSSGLFGESTLFKRRPNGLRKLLKNNSSSPSLDIVFEGSGSIRLESENNTEKTKSNRNYDIEVKDDNDDDERFLNDSNNGDITSDSEDSDFIQFGNNSKSSKGESKIMNGYDFSSVSQLTDPFSSSSSSSGGDGDGKKFDEGTGDEFSSKKNNLNKPVSLIRKRALAYQKELRQLNNASLVENLHVEKVYLYIQMQLCRKDTLKDWLKTNCEHRDKTTIFDLFYQIVDAVEYVHSQDLIHRDLKPSNIFFSLDGTLKIGDFGLCRTKTAATGIGSSLDLQEYVAESDVERSFEAVHTEQVGTQLYMSPEQLNGLSYNQKVDIFAMGLILLELMVPFKTQMQRVNVLFKARNNLYSDEFRTDHQQEHELVKSLLSRSPSRRPTATEIKQHELLASAQLSQPVIERIYHRRRTISSNSSTE